MKINCPAHEDRTPSLHIYEDGCFCFVCGFTCDIKEVLNEEEIRILRKTKPEKEDVEKTIRYIQGLPKREVRGFNLHSDNFGYYIIWPDESFYKKRLLQGRQRYVGPRGHRPNLFKYESGKHTCVVVEGELNAMSLYLAIPDYGITVVSPGSASELSRHISYYSRYKYVIIIVDKDPAGVVAGLELKKQLISKVKRVNLIALEKDFNQILKDNGISAVRQKLIEELGL